MKFTERSRSGEVLGNKVTAKPVPYARMLAIESARGDGDSLAVVREMCGIIRDYVTMEDGTPIDADDISTAAITALFSFATDMRAEGVGDFTPTP